MDITVVCYGEVERFKTRRAAFEKYVEGMVMCDGHESERYANVVCCLQAGEPVAWDFEEVPKGYEHILNEDLISRCDEFALKQAGVRC